MMKKTTDILTWALALAPVVLVAVLYGRLPERVPTHWGLDGAVTYSGKGTMWLTALLPLVLLVLFKVLPKIDPRKRNYGRFRQYYDGFCLALVLFLAGLNGIALTEALRPGTLSVGRVIIGGLGLLFVFVGNMLPKVKSNFFLGIKTPWTLSDPDVWNRTHRLGGLLFFLLGAGMVLGGLLLPERANLVLVLGGALASALIPAVMSYIWYRQKAGQDMDKDQGR